MTSTLYKGKKVTIADIQHISILNLDVKYVSIEAKPLFEEKQPLFIMTSHQSRRFLPSNPLTKSKVFSFPYVKL